MEGIYFGNCLDVMKRIDSGTVNLVATDPPFNIGYSYDLYKDKKGYTEYKNWCTEWLLECKRVLAPNGSIYVCIGQEYAAELNVILKEIGMIQRGWIIWKYGFGVACKKKFQRCHTHIHWFSKSQDYVFNADEIRVPSDRLLKYKDKRADPRGKIPSDVWDFQRVCGTFKERIKDETGTVHPCQMNASVIERMIRVSSFVGDLVLDPFCGSGTTASTAHLLGRRFITCDVSESYCQVAANRILGDKNSYKICPSKSDKDG